MSPLGPMHLGARRRLSHRRGKLVAIGLAALTGLAALALGEALLALLAVMIGLYVAAPRLEQWLGLWRASRRASGWTPALAPDREVLEGHLDALGLDARARAAALQQAAEGEVVLGAFSQDDRLVSEVGPIPALAAVLARTESHAEPKRRHRVELVVRAEGLCVRKTYRNYRDRNLRARWFAQELAALERLDALDAVPSVVEARPHDLVLYQTFFDAPTLSALLTDAGVPRSMQKGVRGAYRGPGARADAAAEERRAPVLAALAEVVSAEFLSALGALIERVHEAGVLLGDVKYGNVIVADDGPRLVDFDLARVHRPASATFRLAREREMDLVRFTFGFEEQA